MAVKHVICALILGGFSCFSTGVLADVSESSVSVMIEQPLHGLGVDGSDALIAPGTYLVETADTWLRLVPGKRRDAILLEAEGVVHLEAIIEPMASLTSVDEDTQEILLLLPNGTGLKALGTYSGVMSRGMSPGKQRNRLVPHRTVTSSSKATPKAQERKPQGMKRKKERGSGVPNLTPEDPWDKFLLGFIQQQGKTIKGLQAEIKGLQAKVEKLKTHKHTYKLAPAGFDGIYWVTLRQLLAMDDDHPYIRDNMGTWFGPQKKDRGQTGEIPTSEPKY